jgi:hypothetical protein
LELSTTSKDRWPLKQHALAVTVQEIGNNPFEY